jgi:DNA-binding beta-propeller fold protein YncE
MSWYAGKVRVGVIAIFCAVALAVVGLHRFSGRAYSSDPTPALFVTDVCSSAVTAYPAASNGDVSPFAPVPTGLSEPEFVAFDANGNIYATNACTNTVTIYAKGSNGDATPTAIIGGSKTGLNVPYGIAVDSTSGNIYVVNRDGGSVTVYPALGSSTGLLNEAPMASITGSNTGLFAPAGLALDSSGNIYVADGEVLVYPALGSSTGPLNEAPTATISGSNTGLLFPFGIALDSSRNIYVADGFASSVFVYPALGSSTGTLDEAPLATISGSNTGLMQPEGIALDSSDKIYVADPCDACDGLPPNVFVYPELGSSAGLLNEVPAATISGPLTELIGPVFVAFQPSAAATPTATATAGRRPQPRRRPRRPRPR